MYNERRRNINQLSVTFGSADWDYGMNRKRSTSIVLLSYALTAV